MDGAAPNRDGGESGALVGSISHILSTLFRELIEAPPAAPTPEEVAVPGEADADAAGKKRTKKSSKKKGSAAVEAEPPPSVANPEDDGDKSEGEGGDPAVEDGEPVLDENGEPVRQPKPPSRPKTPPPPLPPPDPLEQLTEHERSAVRQMAAIDGRLEAQTIEYARTLTVLREARLAAAREDIREENVLKKQGILVNAHIPIGASHLHETMSTFVTKDLDTNRSNLAMMTEIVSAGELMADNLDDYLYKSGNKPRPVVASPRSRRTANASAEGGDDGMPDDTPGYLKTTGSLSKRKAITLKTSTAVHGSKHDKRSSSALHMAEAALDEALRSEIDADLGSGGQAAAMLPSPPPGRNASADSAGSPKKKHVHHDGEQVDVDRKVQERMDQKLMYTRNPRYDPGNKNNHRLLTLPVQGTDVEQDITGLLCPTGAPEGGTGAVIDAWAARTKAGPEGDHGFFVAAPAVVEFTDYEVDEVYETTLLLRNVTAVTRTLQILPLATQFFCISSMEYPNENSGALAPGMAISVKIQFQPDSLADYEDQLTVKTEAGDFQVRVWAHRPPPILEFRPPLAPGSLDLDVGACLVGDAKCITFDCHNVGGRGRFRLLMPEDFPEPSAAQRDNLALRMPPFNVTPTEFALNTGDSVEITVDYVPLELGQHQAKFILVCDNCQIKTYSVSGRSECVDLSISSVNGGDCGPVNQPRQLQFDSLAIGDSGGQTMTLTNMTSIDLNYRWDLRPAHTEVEIGKALPPTNQDRDDEPLEGFNILPRHGVMRAQEDFVMDVTYAPIAQLPTGTTAVLVIEGVPPPSVPSDDQEDMLSALARDGHGEWLRMQSWFRQLDDDGSGSLGPEELKAALEGLGMKAHKRAMRELMETLDKDGDGEVDLSEFMEHLPSDVKQAIEERLPAEPHEDIQKMIRCDVECITLDLQGAGEPVNLAVEPATVVVPGQLVAGSTYTKELWIENMSNTDTEFSWGKALSGHTDGPGSEYPFDYVDEAQCRVKINPPLGLLGPRERRTCELQVTPKTEGRHEITLPCLARGGVDGGTVFRVTAVCAGPRIRFSQSQPEVDLGLMAVGTKAERPVTFTNEGLVPCTWELRPMADPNAKSQDANVSSAASAASGAEDGGMDAFNIDRASAILSCIPPRGILAPGESATSNIICEAGRQPERVRAVLECLVAGTDHLQSSTFKTQYISLRGEVQSPKVHLNTTHIAWGTCFVGVPVVRTVTLTNLSNLSTKFKWERPMGIPTAFDLKFEPAEGAMAEKESLEIKLTFTAGHTGVIDELFACVIFGMPRPLGFSMKASAKGVVVAYENLPDATPAPPPLGAPKDPQYLGSEPLPQAGAMPKLFFGDTVPLFERRTMRFVIRNLSAIAAPFNLAPHKFKVYVRPVRSWELSDPNSAHSKASRGNSQHYGRRRILDNAHEEKGPYRSKEGRAHILRRLNAKEDEKILQAGNGVAFSVSPAQGTLPPWGVAEVVVTAFNEMPGSYSDDLECHVEGAPLARLNLKMMVKGCPLSLVKGSAGVEVVPPPLPSWLRFSDVLVGSPEVTKLVRVRNEGPIGALVNWTVREPDDSGPDDRVVEVGLESTGDPEAPVKLGIKWKEAKQYTPPYRVTPASQVIQPHSDVKFSVTLLSSSISAATVGAVKRGTSPDVRAVMVLDAHWEHPTPAVSDETAGSEGASRSASAHDSKAGAGSSGSGAGRRGSKLGVGSAAEATDTGVGGGSEGGDVINIGGPGSGAPAHDKRSGGGGGGSSVASRGSTRRKSHSDGGLERETLGAIKVQLSATPIQPKLMLDKHVHADKGSAQFLKFVAYSTNLVAQATKRPFHSSQMRSVVLANPLGVPLTFSVSTTEPFQILSTKCLAPPHPLMHKQALGGTGSRGQTRTKRNVAASFSGDDNPEATAAVDGSAESALLLSQSLGRPQQQGGIYTLPPQENLTLQMVYVPPKLKLSTQPGAVSLKHADEGVLNLNYATGQLQTIKLVGQVMRPMIVCAPSEHEYGIVHTEGKAQITIFVSNPTEVEASWKIRHVPVQPPKVSIIASEMDKPKPRPRDEPDVFSFSEYGGSQKGPSLPLESAGDCLPKDENRSDTAVFAQTLTEVTWKAGTSVAEERHNADLAQTLTRLNDNNPRAPRPVVVTFRPSIAAQYQSRFRFEVERGEGFDVVLSGTGTYSENSRELPPPHFGPSMTARFE
mmetsp:Transcript_28938/g.67308  ORF Transcript_28938/g.67308 Transcript_28938/m.67308 type:complete len:2187 (+) Transcript_28938:98-6658(+)